MKMLLYIAILIGVWLIPVRGTDVGKLIPVEVIAVSETGGTYTVRTDTGDLGQGRTWDEAFSNLKETSRGVIYLDTAEYLLIEQDAELEAMKPYLKGSVKVCAADAEVEIEGIADFLSVHKPEAKLAAVENMGEIQVIIEKNGRYLLKEK